MVNTVYLLRHGLRLDGEDETYWPHYAKREHDTPLSFYGLKQVEETAEFLENEKIDHIFSSPFFRALQTANAVAKKQNLLVNIEYGFSEQLATKWFGPTFPDITTPEEAVKVLSNINPDYKTLVMPTYPEESSKVDVSARVKRALDEVFKQYSGTILIVGHGASMWETACHLTEDDRSNYNKRMCALHKFERNGDKWDYVLSTTDHLSYIDDMYDDPQVINTIPEQYRKKQTEIVQFPIERRLDRVEN